MVFTLASVLIYTFKFLFLFPLTRMDSIAFLQLTSIKTLAQKVN